MQILRGDLEKSLKEKYFNEAEFNANVFGGWKPDEKNEVHAIQWESVDVKNYLLYW